MIKRSLTPVWHWLYRGFCVEEMYYHTDAFCIEVKM